jgi:hypothetical protein
LEIANQHLGNDWKKVEKLWNVAEEYGGNIWLVEFPYCPFNFHEIP